MSLTSSALGFADARQTSGREKVAIDVIMRHREVRRIHVVVRPGMDSRAVRQRACSLAHAGAGELIEIETIIETERVRG